MAAANEIQCDHTADYHQNYTIIPSDMVVWLYNEEIVKNRWISIYFAGTLMLIGLLGNGFVIYAFGLKIRKTPANIFILSLALCDMVGCTVCIPFEIFQLRFVVYSYTNTATCKLLRVICFTTYCVQGLMLLAIGLDRYLKICRPLKIYRCSKPLYSIMITVTAAVLLAWPAGFIYGTKTIYACIPGVYGKSCSVDDCVKETPYPILFYGILLGIFMICFIVLFLFYVRIVQSIREWKNHGLQYSKIRKLKKRCSKSNDESEVSQTVSFRSNTSRNTKVYYIEGDYNSNNEDTDNKVRLQRISKNIEFSERSFNSMNEYDRGNLHQNHGIQTRENESVKDETTQNKMKNQAHLTKSVSTFTIVTVCFVVSYVPYLACEILLKTKLINYHQQTDMLQRLIEVAEKSYCINNACNPIIYSIFNPEFRRKILHIFKIK